MRRRLVEIRIGRRGTVGVVAIFGFLRHMREPTDKARGQPPPHPRSAADSARMRRVPQRDTAAELALRRELHRRGLRYRVDTRALVTLRRRADIVFSRAHIAVFVDGCFWHGCPLHMTWPEANGQWWRDKIERNRARDRETDKALRAAGWQVIRVWEHESQTAAADRVERAVTQARVRPGRRAGRVGL